VLGCGRGWFAVLPDCAAAAAAAELLIGRDGMEVVGHASGRPWLVGRWVDGEVVVATAGLVRLAVIGDCAPTAEHLAELVTRVDRIEDLDHLAVKLAGSVHLVASIGGRVRAQGTASGLRRLFSARLSGVTIGADRSDVLAGVIRTSVDTEAIAVRLAEPLVPHPLAEQSVWQGVNAVSPGSFLLLDQRGDARVGQWWIPPEPEVGLATGAPRMAQVLAEAVALRTSAGGTISADLSGGLDSTPLCFLAARGPAKLIAFTRAGADPGHDDVSWAVRAAAHLPDIQHLLVNPRALPPFHAALLQGGQGLDEPALGGRVRAQKVELAHSMTQASSRLHLAGEGGDQVVQAFPSYLHATLRNRPNIGVAHLRAWAARRRWPLVATLRAAADRRPYGQWLHQMAADLSPLLMMARVPELGWQHRVGMPPWASAEAVATVRGVLRRAASAAEPLATTRAQHEVLLSIRSGARMCRALTGWSAQAGLPVHYPFLDDRVIEACLAVRLHERTTPFAYKPLTVAAMGDIVPAELLARSTKGEFSVDLHAGLRAQRADLTELLDEPILARLGLVDADLLRRAALGLYPPRLSLAALEATLAAETWLHAHRNTILSTTFTSMRQA
jgi:asparagine synthase (glutamine-hydrolysing)